MTNEIKDYGQRPPKLLDDMEFEDIQAAITHHANGKVLLDVAVIALFRRVEDAEDSEPKVLFVREAKEQRMHMRMIDAIGTAAQLILDEAKAEILKKENGRH